MKIFTIILSVLSVSSMAAYAEVTVDQSDIIWGDDDEYPIDAGFMDDGTTMPTQQEM